MSTQIHPFDPLQAHEIGTVRSVVKEALQGVDIRFKAIEIQEPPKADVFPYIEAAAGKDAVKAIQYPFYVSSALCIFSAFLAFFFLPEVGQDTVEYEDSKYREYLQHHGWDTRQLDGSHVNLIQNEHMVEAGKPSY